MRIAHLTDLHVQLAPRLRDLPGKRLIGTANLYMMGRRLHFSPDAQRAAVTATLEATPDLVIITGDLTAQGLDAEFDAARALLDPLLSRFPVVIIAGNHDTYVKERAVAAAMRERFGAWMGERTPWLHHAGGCAVLTLETCRAHPLSSGYAPPDEIEAARGLLSAVPSDAFLFLAIHYPLRGRDGAPYGPRTRALSNAAAVEALIASTSRIDAVLHGHEHRGFRTTVPGAGGLVPIFDPGASGYAWRPDHQRTAHLNLYTVAGRSLTALRRLAFDGDRFREEPGGPYQSGW